MATGDLVIPDGFGNAVLSWNFTGRSNPLTVGLGFSPDSGTDPSAMADDIFAAATTGGAPCAAASMVAGYTFNGVTVTYNDGGTIVGGASSLSPVVGTASGSNPMIIGSTFLVQKRSGLVGKKFRGRFYWPISYGTETGIDALGNLDSTDQSVFQGYMTAFFDNLLASTPAYIPNILHHQPAVGSPPVPTVITSFALSGKVATQRRRLR